MSQPSFRNLFKDVAIYGFGDFIFRAASLLTLPIYSRVFTPADYGVLSYVLTITNIMSAMLALGFASAYSLYFFEATTDKEKQLVTSTCLWFIAIWSFAISLVGLPFTATISEWSFRTSQYGLLIKLAFLTVPLGLINTLCGQVLRNEFKAGLFTSLNVASAFLTVGFGLYGVLVLKLGLMGVIGGALLAACVILPVRLWTVRGMLRLKFSSERLKQLLAYGLPLLPMTVAYWIFEVSDRIVLGKLSTLEQLGLYSLANTLTSGLAFVNGALGQAWSPHAFKLRMERPDLAPAFFGQVLTYILVAFGILAVGISVFAHEVLVILSTPRFYPAAFAIGPLALGFVAYASTQVTAAGLSLGKKTTYFAIFSWIAAAINIGLNVLFVARWGMMAASWSTAASYIFLTFAYMLSSQKYFHVSYEKQRAIMVSLGTVIFILAIPLLPHPKFFLSVVMKIVYCALYVALLFFFHVLDKREIGIMLRLWQELRGRTIGEVL